jgi:hypothetical protein
MSLKKNLLNLLILLLINLLLSNLILCSKYVPQNFASEKKVKSNLILKFDKPFSFNPKVKKNNKNF